MNNKQSVFVSYCLHGGIIIPVNAREGESLYDAVSNFVSKDVSDLSLIDGLIRAPHKYGGLTSDSISIESISDTGGGLLWVQDNTMVQFQPGPYSLKKVFVTMDENRNCIGILDTFRDAAKIFLKNNRVEKLKEGFCIIDNNGAYVEGTDHVYLDRLMAQSICNALNRVISSQLKGAGPIMRA